MKTRILILTALAVSGIASGCANYDPEQFQKSMQAAYLINQYQNQWQAPLNAQNYAAAQARRASLNRIDTEWDWDEFYGQEGRLVWACRGVQTGQFAEQFNCNYLPKSDFRWPDKHL